MGWAFVDSGDTTCAQGTAGASFAAEAAARQPPLKRQCCARLRARAESRVYPRTWARRCSLMKTVVYEDGRVTRTVVPRTDWNDPAARFAAEAAARRLPLKRQCTARL